MKQGRKAKMKTATALLAALLLANAAAEAATARRDVIVGGDVVTVGDVFEGAGEHASYVLAPAPQPGRVLTLNARDLQRVSDAFSLGWKSAGPSEQSVIRSSANAIDRFAIEAALQEKLRDASGSSFEVILADRTLALPLPQDAEQSVVVERLDQDLSRNEFRAVVAAPAVNPLIRREVAGKIHRLTEIPVLSRDLRAGDVISAGDISYVEMRASDVGSMTVIDAEKLIGMTPRRGITAMKTLTAKDVEAPRMVKKGETVTMILRNKTISLTAQGRALQNGTVGDIVRVVNPASNQVVEAVVTGPQTVSVAPPGAVLENNG